ncbi:hypothetical protein CLV78_102208 [Aliiruegeria haliotis]|uniref:Histidine kinase n=1 Tax=Aliiruegeria haliotis TaxID=1280846 RepID=A0A2T0RV19_9RHOB|nr:DUF6446 family protein [Aliiruegeria haliotis]PRY25031.1 hypothetical protein CLV78_102208 [Aliiruegeria haliotis]
MSGKIIAGGIVVLSIIAGIAIYYLQVYHYYEEVDASGEQVMLTLLYGAPEPILAEGIEAIDATSSPIRYRACFTTPMSQAMLTETYEPYPQAEPLNAPHWFDCFDSQEIGLALEQGEALAFLGERNFAHGVDRVVAIFGDGRGYVWHQVNEEMKK